jgi:lipopolysaccharide export system protein LptA
MKTQVTSTLLAGFLALSGSLATSSAQNASAITDKAKSLLDESQKGAAGSKDRLAEITEALKKAENGNMPSKDKDAMAALIAEAQKPGVDAADIAQKVDEMRKSASPEAKKLLDKEVPNAKTSDAAKAAKATSTGARTFASVSQPPPKEVKAPGSKEKKSDPKAMIIDADKLFMDQERGVALFKGNVRLRSSDMDADCEEMEIFFKDGALKGMADAPPGAEAAKDAPKPEADAKKEATTDEDKIEKVFLKGNGRIITIVKRAANGDAICKAKQAIYDSISGTLLLKEFPEAEHQGKRLVGSTVAASITITKDMQISGVGTRAIMAGGKNR